MDEQLNRKLKEEAPELTLKRNAIIEEGIKENQLIRKAPLAHVDLAENEIEPPKQLAPDAQVILSKVPIPRKLRDAVNKLLSWEGLSKDTSQKIHDKAEAFINADTEGKSANALMLLLRESLQYMRTHKGYRFTKSGENRKEDLRKFMKQAAGFFSTAGTEYLESFSGLLQNPNQDSLLSCQ